MHKLNCFYLCSGWTHNWLPLLVFLVFFLNFFDIFIRHNHHFFDSCVCSHTHTGTHRHTLIHDSRINRRQPTTMIKGKNLPANVLMTIETGIANCTREQQQTRTRFLFLSIRHSAIPPICAAINFSCFYLFRWQFDCNCFYPPNVVTADVADGTIRSKRVWVWFLSTSNFSFLSKRVFKCCVLWVPWATTRLKRDRAKMLSVHCADGNSQRSRYDYLARLREVGNYWQRFPYNCITNWFCCFFLLSFLFFGSFGSVRC